MRRAIAVTALVVLLLLGGLCSAGPAMAKGPPGFFGLVPQGGVPPNADIHRMARGKVGTVRLVANWALIGILIRISDTARRPAPAPAPSSDAEMTQVVRP